MKRDGTKYPWVMSAHFVLVCSAFSCSAPEDGAAIADQASVIQFRLARTEPAPGLEEVEFAGDTPYLESPPIISDEDFESVEPYFRSGEWHFDFQVTPRAAERLFE